ASPIFFETLPLIKPRMLWFCHSVASAISAIVPLFAAQECENDVLLRISSSPLRLGFPFGRSAVLFLAAPLAAFAVLAFFPPRFVFNVASFVVVLSVVAASVLIVISFLAVDPRLTIHHSGWPGKRGGKITAEDRSLRLLRNAEFQVYENAVIRQLKAG